jgi:hypothetical protein
MNGVSGVYEESLIKEIYAKVWIGLEKNKRELRNSNNEEPLSPAGL